MRSFKIAFFALAVGLLWGFSPLFAEPDLRNGYLSPECLEIAEVSFAADPYSKAAYDPFIKMRVLNNSSETITKAIIIVEVTADNGKMRLFKDKLAVTPNGALKAYGTDVWLLYPPLSSEIALKGLPRDARITAYAEKVLCKKRNSPWFYEHKFNYKRLLRGGFR